jgi:hypothetical protein
MDDPRDRRVAGLLGLLAAVLIGLDGLLDLARGLFSLAVGRVGPAYFPFDQGVILVAVALLVAAFSVMGGLRRDGRSTVAGVVLLVVVVVGWLALGLGSGLLSLLGALLGLVAGVVFLVSGR